MELIYLIQFRKDSQAVLILKYLCLCGEFPWQSLYLLPANGVTLRRTISKMRKEKYLTVLGSAQYKTIRMTKKAFPIIEKLFPELLAYYLEITDNHHFRGGVYKNDNVGHRQTWRRHRMAEVLCVFGELDCRMVPIEKAPLVSSVSYPANISSDEKVFYSSVELKNLDPEQKYKTDFTRLLGLYLSPGGVYCVYNTNKRLMKWNTQGETKAQVLVEDVVRTNYEPYIASNFFATDALVFGGDLDMALRILNNNIAVRKPSDFEFLSFNNVYDNIYYVTLDDNGIRQLNIMSFKNWHSILKKIILGVSGDSSSYNVDCDAIIDNKYVLMFLDGNLARLQRFKQAKDLSQEDNFKIICYPWQVDFIFKYFNNDIEIATVSIDSVENEFMC